MQREDGEMEEGVEEEPENKEEEGVKCRGRSKNIASKQK